MLGKRDLGSVRLTTLLEKQQESARTLSKAWRSFLLACCSSYSICEAPQQHKRKLMSTSTLHHHYDTLQSRSCISNAADRHWYAYPVLLHVLRSARLRTTGLYVVTYLLSHIKSAPVSGDAGDALSNAAS